MRRWLSQPDTCGCSQKPTGKTEDSRGPVLFFVVVVLFFEATAFVTEARKEENW